MNNYQDFEQNSFNLIAGKSGSGTTAFLIHRAVSHAKEGLSVLYMTIDQSPKTIQDRINQYAKNGYGTGNIKVRSLPTNWTYDLVGEILVNGENDADVCIIDGAIPEPSGLVHFRRDFGEMVTLYNRVQVNRSAYYDNASIRTPSILNAYADSIILMEFDHDVHAICTTYLKSKSGDKKRIKYALTDILTEIQ